MFKRILSGTLIVLLVQLACAYPLMAADSKKDSDKTEKVRAAIFKLGTGPEARVKIKMKDNTKLEGYISEAGPDHFILVDKKTGAAVMLEYSNVRQIVGSNASRGMKIAIGVIAAITLVILVVVVAGGAKSQ